MRERVNVEACLFLKFIRKYWDVKTVANAMRADSDENMMKTYILS
jgi:hypothetical protein